MVEEEIFVLFARFCFIGDKHCVLCMQVCYLMVVECRCEVDVRFNVLAVIDFLFFYNVFSVDCTYSLRGMFVDGFFLFVAFVIVLSLFVFTWVS